MKIPRSQLEANPTSHVGLNIVSMLVVTLAITPQGSAHATPPQQIEDLIYLSLTSGNVESAVEWYRTGLDGRIKRVYTGRGRGAESAATGGLSSLIRFLAGMERAIIWLRQEGIEDTSRELLEEYVKGAVNVEKNSRLIDDYYTSLSEKPAAAPPPGPARLEWFRHKNHIASVKGLLESCSITMINALKLIGETPGFKSERIRFDESAKRHLPLQDNYDISSTGRFGSLPERNPTSARYPLQALAQSGGTANNLTTSVAEFLSGLYRDLEKGEISRLRSYVGSEFADVDPERVRRRFHRFKGWGLRHAAALLAREVAAGEVEVRVEGALFVSHVGTRVKTDHTFRLRRRGDSFLLQDWEKPPVNKP